MIHKQQHLQENNCEHCMHFFFEVPIIQIELHIFVSRIAILLSFVAAIATAWKPSVIAENPIQK